MPTINTGYYKTHLLDTFSILMQRGYAHELTIGVPHAIIQQVIREIKITPMQPIIWAGNEDSLTIDMPNGRLILNSNRSRSRLIEDLVKENKKLKDYVESEDDSEDDPF